MIENLKLINEHFPDWNTHICYADDVPESILDQIRTYNNVVLKPSGVSGHENMTYRFFVIDEPGVDRMVVRDADSRIHERDRWAIREWVDSGKPFHIIRDHHWHTTQIMGGAWGACKTAFGEETVEAIYRQYSHQCMNFGEDQSFLASAIYPRVWQNALYHCHLRMTESEPSSVIPFPVKNGEFIGQVVEYVDGIPVPTME
jgi:hypothetical protein